MIGTILPLVTFKTRVRDPLSTDVNPFVWKDVTTEDLFAGKKVVLFSLPGAFTPTCSTYQLPDFEILYPAFKEKGIDDVYCISVNDSFVMNKWAQLVVEGGLRFVKVIPDGSGEFTEKMGMLVDKDNLGFGKRSWRYAIVVEDMLVTQEYIEPGIADNHPEDPYGVSSPQNILENL